MAYFRTQDGCSLYYETVGFEFSRPAIVFLNGTMQTTLNWRIIAESFMPVFRSLLYDARGQGESETGDQPLALERHLEDLIQLIRHLELGPVCLVGISHGARLAYAMARRVPEMVTRLVLCALGTRSPVRARLIVRSWLQIIETAGLETMVNAAIPHIFGETYLRRNVKSLDRMVKTIVRRNRNSALAAHLQAIATYPSMRSRMGRLKMPVLVMGGSDDPLVSVEGAAELAATSGGRHLIIDGVGHTLPVEAPERFVTTAVQFLSGQWTDLPEGL